MKAALKLTAVLLFILFQYSCGKSGGGDDNPTPPEENLVITLDPDPGSTTTPVRVSSATYTLNVVIQSAMPPQGVDVKWDYKKDSDGSIISQSTASSATNKTIPVTITNLPQNEQGTVTITVTSKTKATNTASKTFKLVRK
jgi:hypothetical protein